MNRIYKRKDRFKMKKSLSIIIGVVVVAVIAVIAISIILMNSRAKTNLNEINTAEDLTKLVKKIYDGTE